MSLYFSFFLVRILTKISWGGVRWIIEQSEPRVLGEGSWSVAEYTCVILLVLLYLTRLQKLASSSNCKDRKDRPRGPKESVMASKAGYTCVDLLVLLYLP